MITALDANILLDVLGPDPTFGPSSREQVRRAAKEGALIICEIVYVETAGFFQQQFAFDTFLRDTGIRVVHSTSATLWKAGELWRHACLKHREAAHAGRGHRVPADFLIGAHALLQADRLLTRDLDFYRSAFSRLVLA